MIHHTSKIWMNQQDTKKIIAKMALTASSEDHSDLVELELYTISL